MAKFGISQSVPRTEDARLLTGRGRYTADIEVPGQTWCVFVRSPHAHARIRGVATATAQAIPGVLGVFTAADLKADGVEAIPCEVGLKNADGTPRADPPRFALAAERVRHVGDTVAFVVAETQAAARDAAEAVAVDYEPLPAAVEIEDALAPGRPQVHGEAPGNRAFQWETGDKAAVEAAMAGAARVVRLDLVNNRVVVASMEPRCALAEWDAKAGKLTFHAPTQGGWGIKKFLAGRVLKVAPEKVRVVTPEVGGGFGMKGFVYPEFAALAWAARKLDRPVKWVGERTDAFLTDAQGRDHRTTIELAFDADHRIRALRVRTLANLGAYLSTFAPFIPTMAANKVLPGVYDVGCHHYAVTGVFTHTTPVDAYRGAGRPEAIYQLERAMDHAARVLKVDRLELRRRNMIPPARLPFRTSVGETYDSGDFPGVMADAAARAGWAGFEARRAEAFKRGRRRGIGLCYYIESTMGSPKETARLKFLDDAVEVLVGTQSNGQGHETAYAQIVSERLGIPFERIRVVQGDTDAIPMGGGTGGSRSVTAEGWALLEVSRKVVERGRTLAGEVLEVAAADVEFREGDGTFRVVGTDRAIQILDLARRARAMPRPPAGLEGGLDDTATIEVGAWTFPNGCHVAEVEIDPETGTLALARYTIVDDFGRLINPLLVEGQVHGGVVQGIGQALMEHATFGADGQPLAASFLDYALPRAADLPSFDFATQVIPCRNNPLGMKGCGEAGAVASPAAVVNAAIDALTPLGVLRLDMPLTPQSLWRAIRQARGQAAAAE